MKTNEAQWVVRLTLANGRTDEIGGFACREAAEVFVLRAVGNANVLFAVVHYRD